MQLFKSGKILYKKFLQNLPHEKVIIKAFIFKNNFRAVKWRKVEERKRRKRSSGKLFQKSSSFKGAVVDKLQKFCFQPYLFSDILFSANCFLDLLFQTYHFRFFVFRYTTFQVLCFRSTILDFLFFGILPFKSCDVLFYILCCQHTIFISCVSSIPFLDLVFPAYHF